MTTLRSGVDAHFDPAAFERFGRYEWPYYDGIPDHDPSRILPDDVQVTVSMNSFVNTADKVRNVHEGLRMRCESRLQAIPEDADLTSYDPDFAEVEDLLHRACQHKGVLLAVATKVLHRKRPNLIPMLDSVVINAYCDAAGRSTLKSRSQEGAHAASVGAFVLRAFRSDLLNQPRGLDEVRTAAEGVGAPMTPVRALEVAIWMANEDNGNYR